MQHRLVYYSLTLPAGAPRLDLLAQLEASVHSLRQHNTRVPVVLFAYGALPAPTERALGQLGVTVWPQDPYEAALARRLPHGWQALARYPVLHKFLNFAALDRTGAEQALFLDCDTLFCGDVDTLFTRYAAPDCCAREEPTCARSHYGYDRDYLDETQLSDLAGHLGLRIPPPFNLGVVLWNRAVWRRAPNLDALFVWYAWRFLVWLAMHPATAASPYGECDAARFAAAHAAELLTPDAVRAALPYPSANHWILDQVALWFALGHVDGLTYADFTQRDVLQNGEFLDADPHRSDWVLCHYYTQNMDRLAHWARREAPAAHPPTLAAGR